MIVSSDGQDIVDHVKAMTGGKGAWGAVECVGGDLLTSVASSVRSNGTVLIYGAMSGLGASFSIPDLLFRGVVLKGFWLVTWLHGLSAVTKQQVLQSTMDLLANKVITPYSGTVYTLDKVVEAVAHATSDSRGGKVLLEG